MGLIEVIDDATKLQAFPEMFFELIGGREIAVALDREHNGECIRSIAASFGVSKSFLHTRMTRAKIKLRRLKLMPPTWEKKAKLKAVKTVDKSV